MLVDYFNCKRAHTKCLVIVFVVVVVLRCALLSRTVFTVSCCWCSPSRTNTHTKPHQASISLHFVCLLYQFGSVPHLFHSDIHGFCIFGAVLFVPFVNTSLFGFGCFRIRLVLTASRSIDWKPFPFYFHSYADSVHTKQCSLPIRHSNFVVAVVNLCVFVLRLCQFHFQIAQSHTYRKKNLNFYLQIQI